MTNPRTRKPQANPQGKGAVPVLDALHALQAWQPDVKSADQILREFCLSTLVLSARFDFRVVPGNTYYLYHGAPRLAAFADFARRVGSASPG